jgi:hypothetical protein
MSFRGLETMEAEFMKYPQARILQLEDEVKREERQREEAEKQLREL